MTALEELLMERVREGVAELVVDAIREGSVSRVGLVALSYRAAGLTLLLPVMNVAPSFFRNPLGDRLEFHNGATVDTHAVDELDGVTLDLAWCADVDEWSEEQWRALLRCVPRGRILALTRQLERLMRFLVAEPEIHLEMTGIEGLALVTVTRVTLAGLA